MKQFFTKFRHILPIYIVWISLVVGVGTWSIHHLPFSPSFPYYDTELEPRYSREIASFAHFDGIHYLRLIRLGYDDTGSQAFFPAYPLLIRIVSMHILDPLSVAVMLNSVLLFCTLMLVTSMASKTQSQRFYVLFLSLPTSFYLLANYTESFFIFLVALFFYLIQQKKFFPAALIAGIASATRVVGGFLALALLIELIQQTGKKNKWEIGGLLAIAVSGLASYMFYLFHRWGDPLMFMHVMGMFGVGRSTGHIILLPQLLYRYFRVLTTASFVSIVFLRAFWELLTLGWVSIALYRMRQHISLARLIFSISVILFPTLSGTLSSFPRYAIVALPLYIALSQKLSSKSFAIIVVSNTVLLFITIALFVQGIFIA